MSKNLNTLTAFDLLCCVCNFSRLISKSGTTAPYIRDNYCKVAFFFVPLHRESVKRLKTKVKRLKAKVKRLKLKVED